MSHPLFIDDGYTVTREIPDHEQGRYKAFTVEYRPIVGVLRGQLISRIATGTPEEIQKASIDSLVKGLVSIDGQSDIPREKLERMNPDAMLAIRDRVLLLLKEDAEEAGEAEKN